MLTDEQIDRLEGRELDRVMCLHDGAYYAEGDQCKIDGHGWSDIPHYHFDIGKAMGLLLKFVAFEIISDATFGNDSVAVKVWPNDGGCCKQASGSRKDLATIFCRAYLKLKSRSE